MSIASISFTRSCWRAHASSGRNMLQIAKMSDRCTPRRYFHPSLLPEFLGNRRAAVPRRGYPRGTLIDASPKPRFGRAKLDLTGCHGCVGQNVLLVPVITPRPDGRKCGHATDSLGPIPILVSSLVRLFSAMFGDTRSKPLESADTFEPLIAPSTPNVFAINDKRGFH